VLDRCSQRRVLAQRIEQLLHLDVARAAEDVRIEAEDWYSCSRRRFSTGASRCAVSGRACTRSTLASAKRSPASVNNQPLDPEPVK
jgi:hypothetical protein